MKVLIIGGGLGGLCLANGLSKQEIEVQVFERHVSAESGREGYFIHLEAQGMRALQSCLTQQGWADFLATSTPTGAQWAFRDPQLELIAMRDDVKITGKPLSIVERRAIERWELREVLLRALNPQQADVVQWNKTFTRYEELEDGRVRAYFADGTTVEGDVLVAADGSKSKVREQRLPHIKREDLGIGIVCGRYPLSKATEEGIPELMKDGSLNNIVPYGKGWCFISSWRSRERGGSDSGADMEAYTLWAYFIPTADLPSNFQEMKANELRNIALSGVSGWAAPIEKIIREADLTTVTPLYLRCAPHLDSWAPSNITLIGDSIHNMTPAAGASFPPLKLCKIW